MSERETNIDHLAGWIHAYQKAKAEEAEWKALRSAWMEKWKPFLAAFRENLFEALDENGADVGTVGGKPVVRVKVSKVAAHEVKAHERKEISLIEESNGTGRET
jgi:hypothetical protein